MRSYNTRCAQVLGTFLAVLLFVFEQHSYGQYLPSDYFEASDGTLPILVIASHGGRQTLPGVGLRACGSPGVECDADWNTDLLAQEFAEELFLNLRQAPYVVVSHARRTQVDLNREAVEAYDDPNAAPFYDAFHDQIATYIQEIRTTWGRGLIIDLHGQSQEPSKVFRGTKNGLTVTELTNLVGSDLTLGPDSLLGQLEQLSTIDVVPSVSLLPPDQIEDLRFNGGHIVQHYGSHNALGLDAVQIEFGWNFRNTQQETRQTAALLADATASHYRLYQSALAAIPEPHSWHCMSCGLLSIALGLRGTSRRGVTVRVGS